MQQDILGIGYNNINYAYDATTKFPLRESMMPIDVNGNGNLDGEENFYATSDDIVKAMPSGNILRRQHATYTLYLRACQNETKYVNLSNGC